MTRSGLSEIHGNDGDGAVICIVDATCDPARLPYLMTVAQFAAFLQIKESAAYMRIARGQVHGVTRQGRRLRILRDVFLRSLKVERVIN